MNWFTLDYLLIVSVLLAGIFLLSDNNKIVAYIFAGITIAFNALGELIPNEYGSLYYLGAATADLTIIYILSKLSRPSELTIATQDACRAFILVNAMGWVSFMLYMTPELYNLFCTILYLWIFITMIRNKDAYVLGNNAMDRGWAGFPAHFLKGVGVMPRHKRETKKW